MERGIQTCLRQNKKQGNDDNTTQTANMTETLALMLEQLIPEDNPQDDTDYHRAIRKLAEQPIDTPDDKAFTQVEVRKVIVGFKPKKAPGPDGITGGVLQLVYKGIPKTMTAIYNECLKTGCFFPTGKQLEYFQSLNQAENIA